ncbi:MAG: hypothetical protein H0X31_09620 [Nostocaceae cyanobacterium]|nr:hypothetical protein [Nostocaceae cyanobacterium]
MNLSPALQQEIEKIAISQGISSEQFILQTLTEKISTFKQQIPSPLTKVPTPSISATHLREKDGILVFDTESLDHIDFNQLIDQSREDRE